jgi:hypothetical protein
MAAVSAPGYPYVAPPVAPPVRPKRRRWLVAVVVAWVLALTGLAVWSIRRDPPTVPEQRNIAQALPVLQRATGAMLAAAQGPGRAVLLGELRLARGCRITPVRHGIEGTRDVTVYVQADQARRVLDAIAAGLPAGYKARVAQSGNGGRVGLQADAGGYIAVDADTLADAQVFTLEASTGCRPVADTGPGSVGPSAGPAPAVLTAALKALGAPATRTPASRTIVCPSGAGAGTYTVDNLAAPADLGGALQSAVNGATVVRADPDGWAYRLGDDSVVVTEDGGRLQVSATTACH